VESIADHLISRIRSGSVDPARLEAIGIADPADALRAFGEAANDPGLASVLERWVPPLILSAQPTQGARALLRLANALRAAGTPLDLALHPTLPALLGASGILARRLLAHPDWVGELMGALPAAPPDDPIDPDWQAIRRAKYRGLLRIAARDLCGRPFIESLDELSALAERSLVAALQCVQQEIGGPAPALLALGKLGGRELNFSSDVDLLFVYRLDPGSDPGAEAQRLTRMVQRLKTHLEQPSEEGFGYRVDLDLRPEGKAGVLANPVDAALGYYESFGAEWERQALIRLRGVAGDHSAAAALIDQLRPFVYRKLIGPDVLGAVRDMKHRIESERRAAGRDLEACLKEGPGGIRDVEFLVQAFQLLHGGRQPSLRTGNVMEALAGLSKLELLPPPIAAALGDAYLWLRRAEHALQLAEEKQTSQVPRDVPGQLGLARRMGYSAESARDARTAFQEDWTTVRAEVRGHFDALVLGEAS
jgi:glutamate-ammonia-ligase adenylyltransferase